MGIYGNLTHSMGWGCLGACWKKPGRHSCGKRQPNIDMGGGWKGAGAIMAVYTGALYTGDREDAGDEHHKCP
eukprot:2845647-Karenia_brevis.AAC.1